MAGIETFVILAVASFYLPIMPCGKWTDQFMPDSIFL